VANSSYATENIPNVNSTLNYTTVLNYTAPSQNTPFLNYPELQYNSSVNFSSLGLPELYYFGVSGKILYPLALKRLIYVFRLFSFYLAYFEHHGVELNKATVPEETTFVQAAPELLLTQTCI
jgi:hypothetical protein